jgi:hypothetical protein
MSATNIGYSGQLLVTETSFEQSKEGLITYTQKNLIPANINVATPSLTDTKSIDGITLRAVSTNVTSAAGSFAELTIVYQGGTDTTLQQDTTASTGEEPIESNKYFSVGDPVGGDSIITLAGAENVIYNDDNSFRGFSKSAKQNFFGVASFLNPNLVYKRSFNTAVSATATNLSAVGRIVNKDADFPSAVTNATWLCVGVQYIKRGSSYDVTQEFRSSDSNGWNEKIYGPPVATPPKP